jgi:hypothetical protein
MTVTTKTTVKVGTADLRHALGAAKSHVGKVKKDDGIITHRMRLILANGTLLVAATDSQTTALARANYIPGPDGDTRGNLWEPDDGPIVVDLQPRHIPLLLAQFKAKAGESDADLLMAVTADSKAGEITFEDIGGLWSAGERQTFLFDEPIDGFPDVVAITGQALAAVAGQAERGKPLVQDGRILSRFKDATVQYGERCHIRGTGSVEARGFVVQCGPNFIGTVTSGHTDDDGIKSRDRWTLDWLKLLDPRKLQAV